MSAWLGSYVVHGLRLNVEAESVDQVSRLDALLKPFAAPAGGPDREAFVLRITQGEPDPGDPIGEGLRQTWAGVFPGGLAATFYADKDDRRVVLPDRAVLRMNVRRRRAHIIARPGQEGAAEYGCVMPMLCEFLAEVGQHIVHSASLSIDRGGGRRAVVISGVSGRGKTTTALALAQAGWALMADDASFVGWNDPPGQRELLLWGLPRGCKIHTNTLAMFPQLMKLHRRPAETEEEFFIDLADLPGADTPRRVRPSVILFLEPRNAGRHTFTPVDHLAALTRLTRENLRAPDTRADGPAGRAFAVLNAFVRQCECYALSVGADIAALSEQVLALPAFSR